MQQTADPSVPAKTLSSCTQIVQCGATLQVHRISAVLVVLSIDLIIEVLVAFVDVRYISAVVFSFLCPQKPQRNKL